MILDVLEKIGRKGLFCVDPETAHGLSIKALRAGLPVAKSPHHDPRLRTTVAGVTFDNPLLAEVNELNQSSIPYLMLAHFRYGEPSGSVLIQGEMQKLFAGETDPAAIGTALTEGLAAWYEPFQN